MGGLAADQLLAWPRLTTDQQQIRVEKEKLQQYQSEYGYPLMDVLLSASRDSGVAAHNWANNLSAALRTSSVRLRSRSRKLRGTLSSIREQLSMSIAETQVSLGFGSIASRIPSRPDLERGEDDLASHRTRPSAGRRRRSVAFAVSDDEEEEEAEPERAPARRKSMFMIEAIREERRRNRRTATSAMLGTIAYIVEQGRARDARRLQASGAGGKLGGLLTKVRGWRSASIEIEPERLQHRQGGTCLNEELYAELQDALAVLSMAKLNGKTGQRRSAQPAPPLQHADTQEFRVRRLSSTQRTDDMFTFLFTPSGRETIINAIY